MWAGITYCVVSVWGVFFVSARHGYASTTTMASLIAWAVALAALLLHPPSDLILGGAAALATLVSGLMIVYVQHIGAGGLAHGVLLLSVGAGSLDVLCIGVATTIIGAAITIQENADRFTTPKLTAPMMDIIRAAPRAGITQRKTAPKLFM